MSFLNNLFKTAKDSTISLAVRKIADYYIRDYGNIIDFSIDSKNKKIYFDLHLKGENDDLQVAIFSYEIEKIDERAFFRFDKIETSREWLNNVLRDYLPRFAPENSFLIPKKYIKYLKIAM